MSPTPRSRPRSARRSASGRSARCSISAPAPGGCSNCSAPQYRARPRPRSLARHAGGGARQSRPGRASSIAACARATSTSCRCRAIPSTSSSSIRCCTTSTTARAPSARRRACCGPAAGCWSSISRRTTLEFLRDEHAHRRLGFAADSVTHWLEAAGLDVDDASRLCRPGRDGKLTVSLWLGRDRARR